MAAAEHQRPGAVKRRGEPQYARRRNERQRQQDEIEAGEHNPHAPADRRPGAGERDVPVLTANQESGEGAE